jgi:hypothetical protein
MEVTTMFGAKTSADSNCSDLTRCSVVGSVTLFLELSCFEGFTWLQFTVRRHTV